MELYGGSVKSCLRDQRGLTARLIRDGLAPKSKRVNLAALRAWARFTKDADLAELLADLKLPPPHRVHEKRPLELEDWDRLIDAIDQLDAQVRLPMAERAAIEMICLRGFRVGDVCRLTRVAVRNGLHTGLLNYRGKGNRQITWTAKPFESQLEELLTERGWTTVADLIAPDANRETRVRAARQRLARRFRRLARLADIPVDEMTPHRLRRTYAVHFLDQVGGDIEKLRQHMGWANINTAAQYVDHSRREELDRFAEEMARRRRG